ncbi:MAG: phosphoglycerate kinase, partial [FCB group bacterium]|nr:phosphoglycerate kinase [FCB group bacterium]
MAFTFLKAQGRSVGKSLVVDSMRKMAERIIARNRSQRAKLIFPSDVIAATSLESPEEIGTYNVSSIPESMMGLDIGPRSVERFTQVIRESRTIVWNGPVGVFETPGFETGSLKIAETLSECSVKGAITVIGGGDTASAVRQFGLMDTMSHVSTGGGASLELLSGNLSGNQLPALTVLES